VVSRAGDQLLAGARFAADQHGGVALRDLLDDVEHRCSAGLEPTILSKS
jgi:hypothetical protein